VRFRRLRLLSPALIVVLIGSLGLSGCVADPPPIMGAAVAGDGRAVVSWQPPLGIPFPITGYVLTPLVNNVQQTPVRFDSTATTQTVTGLANGTTYTFVVRAINTLGNDSASSAASNAVTPLPSPIGAGFEHTCAVLTGGSMKCWGANGAGELGNGTTSDHESTPVPVTGLTGASTMSGGMDHSCALMTNGTVQCWGHNNVGQLGNGTAADSSTPVSVTGITTATAISVGHDHTCVVLTGATIKCWGKNVVGQLGNGSTLNSSTPVTVSGITNATTVSAGSLATCALLTDTTVKCWGSNTFGQLGNGSAANVNALTPVAVTGLTGVNAITTGASHVCALVANGAAKCWGNNLYGQLGNGTTTDAFTPVSVTGFSGASAISNGGAFTCALLADSSVKCWGLNGFGQLGNGTTNNGATTIPVSVTGLTGATAITTGEYYACVLTAPGPFECWGYNNRSQLGDGTTINSSTPVTATGL
jgi:alpha-tubulin suppressor-like RCC1 family protein